ncbi:MAG TPA: sugar phosphate nucleotidyltransferase, partial [Bacteroidia bacterium]|nr:sugar phosphate nucleotidyltransferase [Bacteroidia bacterium]
SNTESFTVTLVDTGLNTKTAGRLRRVQKFIGDEAFMLTYGDGLTDMNLQDLAAFHSKHGKIATVTAIQPEGKFGGMQLADDNTVLEFQEKPKGDGRWINAGFFVLSPQVFNYLDETSDDIMWEDDPMTRLTNDHELVAYKYDGFWKCMDAMRDRIELENLWNSNQAKWHLWK